MRAREAGPVDACAGRVAGAETKRCVAEAASTDPARPRATRSLSPAAPPHSRTTNDASSIHNNPNEYLIGRTRHPPWRAPETEL